MIHPYSSRLFFFLLTSILFAYQISGQEIVIIDEYRNQIKQLREDSRIQMAFDRIENLHDFTLENHINLTEVPAPPFGEKARGEFFMELLRPYNLDSLWMDDVGNVIGLKRGKSGKRTVCLDAHLDTVFPEGTDVSVDMKGDTLYAPGVGDDTRGLAMVVSIAKAMAEAGLEVEDDILFIGSVGEEGLGDLRGVKHLFRDGHGIDAWISIDGGTLGRVNTQALGSYRYRVIFKGPGGHSWGAFGLVNPHHALGEAIHRFVQRADAYTADGPRTSYNIGIVQGGTSVNSIPFESIMEVDIRSVLPERLDILEGFLEKSVNEALASQNDKKRLGKDLEVEIIKIGNRPSGELSTEIPLIQRALSATALLGKRPDITRGSTNSNIPISMGIPAVTIGRGGVGANAHALDEWWLNKEAYKATQLALILLVAEAGLK